MDDWYKDWFNSKEYLHVYRHRNEAEARELVKLILKNIVIPQNVSVLDLACGTGRHSILFAQKGFNVTAVDLSENLLAVAKKVSESAGVYINFINADLRNFFVDTKYDLAVNLFTSFGYFKSDEENFNLYKVAHRHLNKSGYFVIDFFNSTYLKKNLIPHSVEEFPTCKIIQDRKIVENRVIKTIFINNGTSKKYYESVKLYSEPELSKAISAEGFKIIKKFGDFYGSPFDIETSPRIILIAQK